jgi:ribosomal protein L37AE/L43A
MFCPVCGRALAGPASPHVAYPMFACAVDGVIYDKRRAQWYGLPEVGSKLCCPACGSAMEVEPQDAAPLLFFCYQCGTTFDKSRQAWYGLAYHQPMAP